MNIKLAKLSNLWIVVAIAAVLSSCGGDDDSPKKIANLDPKEIAESLDIDNASFMSGTLPSPSSDEDAPVISSELDGETISTIQGLKVIVKVPIESGDATGLYVKIDGADGYFKVNSPKAPSGGGRLGKTQKKRDFLRSGRTQEEDEASFTIQVPEGIEPGKFCISYCIFDGAGRVSNLVARCVIVSELGGSKATSLTKKWKWLSTKLYVDSELWYEMEEGKGHEETYDWEIPCGDDYVEVEITETSKTDYAYLTLADNGAFQIDEKYSDTYLDWEASDCEPEYTTESLEHTWYGAWSYDADKKELIILYNSYADWEYPETQVQTYDVDLKDGKLVLKYTTYEEAKITGTIVLEEF